MNVNLGDAQLGPIVAKAILDTMSPETREKLIVEAIKDILSKRRTDSYNSPTVIQAAFEGASWEVAQTIAKQILTCEGYLRELMREKARPRLVRIPNHVVAEMMRESARRTKKRPAPKPVPRPPAPRAVKPKRGGKRR